jgi:hypothetical protein
LIKFNVPKINFVFTFINSALTSEDERRHIGNLINFFILRVNYGRDFEQQLTFYVNCRGNFPNIDSVLSLLINSVNKLAMETRTIVKGNHNKRTAAFVKACVAYSFITIPSITSVITRLDLYLITGEIALSNLCLGQADACIEAALNLLSDFPKTIEVDHRIKNSEIYLQSYVNKFLSLIIVVPDSPEKGVLFLLRLFIEKLKEIQFDSQQITYPMILLNTLDTLSWCAQETYPFHFQNVVSNDELYGADPKFIDEVNEISTEVVETLLEILKSLTEKPKLQSTVALEFFERLALKADLTDDKVYQLAVNLWNLSLKNRQAIDLKNHLKVLQHLESWKKSVKNKNLVERMEELVNKIKVKL